MTSGNDSANDEMNQISDIRSRLINGKVAVSDNSSESSINALQDEINQLDDGNSFLIRMNGTPNDPDRTDKYESIIE
tara:strand:+ start:197 stop:427 length:231 start_codon:yes stop_codon:yes gene_type:complete